MTLIASGPATYGTGGKDGFGSGSGAFVTTRGAAGTGTGVRSGDGTGVGAVAARGAHAAASATEIPPAKTRIILVVIIGLQSSFGKPDCTVNTRYPAASLCKARRIRPASPIFPRMPWHHPLTLNPFLRTPESGVRIDS